MCVCGVLGVYWLALDVGDNVTLAGAMTPKAWNGEALPALDRVA